MDALFHTFGIDWRVLLAQLANFAILVVVLTWLLYKPVRKMVAERRKVVEQGIQDAEDAKEMLAQADTKAAARLSEAETEAERVVKDARVAAGSEKTRIVGEAEVRAAQIEKDAQARAAEESAKILRESDKEIARLAVLAAAKAIQK